MKKNNQLNLFLYKKYNDDVINNIELNWCNDATKILSPDKMVTIPIDKAIEGGQQLDKDLVRVCDIISI